MSVPMRWQEPVEPVVAPEVPIQLVALPQRRRATRRARRIRRLSVVCGAAMICTFTALGLRLAGAHGAQNHALHLIEQNSSTAHVVLCGASVERNLGFVTVTGNVANKTKQGLGHVEAVVELKDAQNNTLAVESALLPLDPLRAGETAPFRVEMQDHPGAVSYRVRFRRLLGNALD